MRKSKNKKKLIYLLIDQMGIPIDKQNNMFQLLNGEKLYTSTREGYGRNTKFLDQTTLYTHFMDNYGIKYNIYNDAPRNAKCGTYIIINDFSLVERSYNYHVITD